MTAPLSSVFTRIFWAGVPAGLAIGCLVYGSLGYWIAGIAGLAVGCLIAVGFAIAGTIVTLRFLQGLNDLKQQEEALQAALADEDCPF